MSGQVSARALQRIVRPIQASTLRLHASCRSFSAAASEHKPLTLSEFDSLLKAPASAESAQIPPHPSTVLPLSSPLRANPHLSLIKPGLSAALIDAISGMENKVASLVSGESMYVGKAAALNPGGAKRANTAFGKRRGDSDSIKAGLQRLGMAVSTDTVAPGAAGGKRINFQPETLKQVARTVSTGMSQPAKAAIQATVALRLREQHERTKRDTIVRLAEAVRASAGRSSESGETLSRVQSLAIARFLLQQHAARVVDVKTGAPVRLSRDAMDVKAASAARIHHELADMPFVMAKPVATPLPEAPASVPTPSDIREALEAHRPALQASLRAVRLKQRSAAAINSTAQMAEDDAAAFLTWMEDEKASDDALLTQLQADGATKEELSELQRIMDERAAERRAAAAAGNYELMRAERFGQAIPADVTSVNHSVLGADARLTLTQDDAKRAFVSWMASQDRREKAFLQLCTQASLDLAELRDIKNRIEQNRRLRSSALRRGDVYIRWVSLLSRGYDLQVLQPGDAEAAAVAGGGAFQDIEED